jgi:hypothetical protein
LLRWPRILFGLSLGLYLVVRVTSINLDAWSEQGWFFDPFAWQFLFIIGVLLACAPMRMPSRPRLFDVVAVTMVLTGMVVTTVIEPNSRLLEWVTASPLRSLVIEDKTGLYPFRLLSILALTWLCVRIVRIDQPWLRSRWAAPLVLLGQNSLPVFCGGIVLGFIARIALEYDDHILMQVGINIFGATGMVGLGALAAWYRTKGKPNGPRSAASASSPLLQVNAGADTG